jgi:hypothetical protein
MKRLLVFCALAAALPAGATGPSLPEVGRLDFKLADTTGTLVITPTADATDVVVEIYGLDGLRVGADDMVWARLAQLHPGQPVEVPFALARGAGRTDLVTFVRAGGRQSQLTIRVGDESAEHRRRRNACVKQDGDGRWIEVMGCPERGPEPVVPRPGPAPEITGMVGDVFVDGDVVAVEPGPVYVQGCASAAAERVAGDGIIALPGGPACPNACVAARRLDTRLPDGKRGGAWRVKWAAFRDPACHEPAPVELTIRRGPSPNN